MQQLVNPSGTVYDKDMKITSAKFVKGLIGEDELLRDEVPQVAFVGRSNVGKSSVINALVGMKDLARSSPKPGKTREINVFLINNKFYLVDLPGYGYAKASLDERAVLKQMINWYLLYSEISHHKIVLIIDAVVGATDYDLAVIKSLTERKKDLVIVANKIDKIKKSQMQKRINEIKKQVGQHKLILCSTIEKIGVKELSDEVFA